MAHCLNTGASRLDKQLPFVDGLSVNCLNQDKKWEHWEQSQHVPTINYLMQFIYVSDLETTGIDLWNSGFDK